MATVTRRVAAKREIPDLFIPMVSANTKKIMPAAGESGGG
jgi:hypothetical protein